jgi:ABC-2 type transport system permease protein
VTGTVFDIGYRNYTGGREGRWHSRRAVFKDGLRTALGLGRGGRAKILPWFFIFVLSFIAMIMALIAGAVDRMQGPGAAEQAGIPSHGDYYGIASIVVFVFAAVIGPELLCRDRREGTINLYLVRPITATDYLISRWAAFMVVTLGALWMPQLILFLGLCGGAPDPGAYFAAHWLDIPKFLLAGVAMAMYAVTLAMLTASFTTRRAYASVFLVGLFAVTTPFTAGLSQEIGGTLGGWISMFNLTNIPVHVNDVIFGTASELTEDAPAKVFGNAKLVGWWVLWTLGPAAWLWNRYRRLTP